MTDEPAAFTKREFQAHLRRHGLKLAPVDEAELFAAIGPLATLTARVHRPRRPATCDPLPVVRLGPGEVP